MKGSWKFKIQVVSVTSAQLNIEIRVDRALVIRIEDICFITSCGSTPFHGRVEAPWAIELCLEAPCAAGSADAVAAGRLTGAGVLRQELFRPLCPAHRQ